MDTHISMTSGTMSQHVVHIIPERMTYCNQMMTIHVPLVICALVICVDVVKTEVDCCETEDCCTPWRLF